MTINTIDACVNFATDKPLGVRWIPFEHLAPGLNPLKLAGKAFPKRFRVGSSAVVDSWV